MSQLLASDLNNTEFTGSVSNPDKLLHVEFYMFEPLDQQKSREQGRRVYQTKHIHDGPEKEDPRTGLKYQPVKDTGERVRIPYIRIMKPGDNTSILELPVREDHQRRWPEEWLYFASNEGLIDNGSQVPGWKIEEWTYLNGDMESIRNLKYLRFHTVEQIAGASDGQIQKLGIGGMGLREAAKKSLQERVKHGISQELAAKDAEITALKAADAEKEERLKRLEAALLAGGPRVSTEAEEAPVAPPKKRGGRPKGSKNKPKVAGGEQHTP